MAYDETGVFMIRETLMIVLKIAAPILGAGVCIGLIISIFQSVTSIQDQTLTFVPKIFVMVIVAAILMPWIARKIAEYAIVLFTMQ